MTEARRMASSVFRVMFAHLDEPVAVTVLGRVIGWYSPVPRPGQDAMAGFGIPASPPGRTEAPSDPASVPAALHEDARGVGASTPSGAPASSGRAAEPTGSVARMSQADKDRVLGRVAKGRTG
jgi:hypothetical protein